ncbi:hypothetical protein A8A57_00300 [Lelliottia amnigena]|nr:hypothetical protein A8A57_00300 [Lelliottia amnigena]
MLSQIVAAISFCSDPNTFYLPKRVFVLQTLAMSWFLAIAAVRNEFTFSLLSLLEITPLNSSCEQPLM